MPSLTSTTGKWQPYGGDVSSEANVQLRIQRLRANIVANATIRISHIDDLQQLVTALWSHQHTTVDYKKRQEYGDGREGEATGLPSTYVYTNGSTDNNYISWLNTYSVWEGNGNYYWVAYFTTTRDYTFDFACDDYGDMYIDGNIIMTLSSGADNYRVGKSITLQVNAGWHVIRIEANNSSGKAAIGARIYTTNPASPIWTTRSQIDPPVPAQGNVSSGFLGGNQRSGTEIITNKTTSNILVGGTQEGQTLTLEYAVPGTYTLSVPPGAKVQALIIGAGGGGAGGDLTSTTSPIGGGGGAGGYYGSTNTSVNNLRPIDVRTASITTNLASGNWYEANENSIYARPTWSADMKEYAVWSSVDVIPSSEIVSQRAFYAPYTGTYYITGAADESMEVTIQGNAYNAASGHILSATSATQFFNNWKPIQLEAGQIPLLFTNKVGAAAYGGFFLLIADSTGKGGRPGSGSGNNAVGQMVWKPRDYLTATIYDVITKPTWYPVTNSGWSSWMNSYAVWPQPFQESYKGYWMKQDIFLPYADTYTFERLSDDLFYLYRYNTNNTYAGYIFTDYSWSAYQASPRVTKTTLAAGVNTFAFYVINWPGPGGFSLVIKDSRGNIIWTTRTPTTLATTGVADSQVTELVTTGDTLTIRVGTGGAAGNVRQAGSAGEDSFVSAVDGTRYYYGYGGKGGNIRGQFGAGGNVSANLAANVNTTTFGNTTISYTLGAGGAGGLGGVTGGGAGATSFTVAKQGAPRTGGGGGAGGAFTDDEGTSAGAAGGKGSLYTQTRDSKIAGPGGGGGGAGAVGYINRASWKHLGTEPGLVAFYPETSAGGILDDAVDGTASGALGAGASAQVMPDTGFPAIRFTGATNSYVMVADIDKLRLVKTTDTSFTVEAWVYATGNGTAGTYGGMIINKDSEFEITRMVDGRIAVAIDWGSENNNPDRTLPGGGWIIPPAGSCVVPLKTATHVAMTVNGTILRIYINGRAQVLEVVDGPVAGQKINQYYKTISRFPRDDRSNLYIGSRTSLNQQFDGFIAGVRIWNRARSPQQIFDHLYSLAPEGGFGGSYTGGGFFTGASFYFDGYADNLTVPGTGGQFQFGGDFTVECWMNQNNRAYYSTLFEIGTYTNGILFRPGLETNNFYINNVNYGDLSGNVTLGTWNHIALSRTGITTKLHVNGNKIWQGNVSGIINSNNGALRIGQSNHAGGQYFSGYVTNFRVVKGKAVYTQDSFPVPTSPFANIEGTVFLGIQRNVTQDLGPFNLTITSAGNVKPDTFSPFPTGARVFDEYSAFFDGNGDYVTVPYSSQFAHPTKWTMEMWLYPNSYNTANNGYWNALVTRRPNGGYYAPYVIGLRNGKVQAYMSTTGSSWNLGPAETDKLFDKPGTYTWTAPPGVTSVSVVCIGAGGSGYQGPNGGVAGGDSWFISTGTVRGAGGGAGQQNSGGIGGSFTGEGGGIGGFGGSGYEGGGGGAGGYTGPGGNGAVRPYNSSAGAGGGGSGGTGSNGGCGAGGGGTGVFGLGSNGAFRTYTGASVGVPGLGGSGGNNGSARTEQIGGRWYCAGGGCYCNWWYFPGYNVYYSDGGGFGGGAGGDFSGWGGGGGGLGWKNNIPVVPGRQYTVQVGQGGYATGSSNYSRGAGGAVRIIWPGNTRLFPSTLTQDLDRTVNVNNGGIDGGIKTTQTIPLKQWTHVAITRLDREVSIWVDGQLGASGTLTDNNPNWNVGWPTVIGNNGYSVPANENQFYDGYICNLRITNGLALYNDNFGVPQAPLPRLAGTALLTFQDPTIKDKADTRTNMTVFGDAKMQTFSPFQKGDTGAAAYFDGDGDFLRVGNEDNQDGFTFGNVSFTVEGWMNTTKPPVGNISLKANVVGYSSLISNWTPTTEVSEANFAIPGDYVWKCPSGVTSVSVLCIGGGSSGYTRAGYVNGDSSYFIRETLVAGLGGVGPTGGGFVGNSTAISNVTLSVDIGVSTGVIQAASSHYNSTTDQLQSFVSINGQTFRSSINPLNQTSRRGHTLTVIDALRNTVISVNTYDTYAQGSTILTTALNALPNGALMVLTSFDATSLSQATRTVLNNSFGGNLATTWGSMRMAHLFIGVKNGNTPPVELITSASGSPGILTSTTYYRTTTIPGAGGGGGRGGDAGIGFNTGGGGAGGYSGNGGDGGGAQGVVASEAKFTTPGTFQWTCPVGVTSVSVVCVGAGGSGGAAFYAGGGGGGGGLGYKNNIPVTPGQQYTVTVGAGGVGVSASTGGQGTGGGDSWFIATNYVRGIGGSAGVGTTSNTNTPYAGGAGGGFVGDGGGNGGSGGSSLYDTAGGGGGAGGYGGTGGRGGSPIAGNPFTNGAGGAGSGGAHGGNNSVNGAAQSGGGTGLLGISRSGAAAGQGGSGGTNGSANGTAGGSAAKGGFPGGGGGGQSNDSKSTPGCNGGDGAVRIIWPGNTRSFPNNDTGEINETVGVGAEQLYTQPGTYSWIAPPGVYSINALVIGAGASGNLGSGHVNGGQSYFIDTSAVRALGGQGNAGGTANQAGSTNGAAFTGGAGGQQTGGGGGGGGAAGYTGAGGAGGGVNTNNRFTSVPVAQADASNGDGTSSFTYYRNNNNYAPWRVLDGTGAAGNNGWYSEPRSLGGPTNPRLNLYVDANRPAVNAYRLYGNNDGALDISPKDWTFQGSQDFTVWTTLDTRTNQTGWNVNNGAYFESVFNNGTAYRYYRFNITDWNSNAGTWNNYGNNRDYVGVSEVQLFQAQLVTGTASAGTGGGGGGGGATVQNSATSLGGAGGGVGLYGLGSNGAGGSSFNYSIQNTGVAAGNIVVQASHYNSTFDANTAFVRVNSVRVPYTISRGHTVMVINETTFDVESAVTYDTYGDGQAANRMDAALRGVGDQEIPDGRLVAITSYDSTAMPAFLRGTMRTYMGSTYTDTWSPGRTSHAFIGIKQQYNSSGNPIAGTELVSSASGTAGIISFTVSFGINAGSGGEGGSKSQNIIPTGTNGLTQANISQGGFPGGGGGGINSLYGGGGGGLAYRNSIAVVPGQTYTVVVGAGGSTTVGGRTSKGGDGAVRLLWGGLRSFPSNNVNLINVQPQYAATNGSGGGASGGNGSSNIGVLSVGAPGGGVQIFGEGSNGVAPKFNNEPIGKAGDGGSGGQDGKVTSQVVIGNERIATVTQTTAQGGFPGGGGGSAFGGRGGGGGGLGYINNYTVVPGQTYLVHVGRGGTSSTGEFTTKGGNGAVRIIWPGTTRQFPTANVGVLSSSVVEQGWGVDLDSNGFLVGYAGTGAKITGTRKVTDGQWHHFALVRYGASDLRLYVDGKLDAQGTQNFVLNSSNNVRIGAQITGGYMQKWYSGYLSNLRVQKGVAEYLEDFTPNATNFQNTSKTVLLTLQDPQWRDRSNLVQKISAYGNAEIRKHSPFQATTSTSHSAHFDGDGDYLDVSGTSNFILPGDFTIECFTYEADHREGTRTIFEFGNYRNGILLSVRGNHHNNSFVEQNLNSLPGDFYINGINFGNITDAVPQNQWNHFVIIRSGTAIKLYINGTEAISGTYKGTINTNHADLRIGASRHTTAHFFSGYISNFRITRGIAAYNGDVSSVIDRNNSYFFDGSGDRITTPAVSDWYLSNMNFCMEMWIMPNFIPVSRKTIFGQWNPTTADYNFRFTMETDGSVRYTQSMTGGNEIVLDSTAKHAPFEPGKWYHVMVIANGLNIAMFVEGVRTNFTTWSGDPLNSSALVTMGANADNTDNFTGYISNLRVVRNTIRTTEPTPSVSGEDAPYNMLQENIIEPHQPLRMISQTIFLTAAQTEIVDERGKPLTAGGTPRSIHVGPFGKHQGLTTGTLTAVIPVPQTKLTATTSTSLGNSVFFDGTVDYLTLADSNDWALNSVNDYVIEFWVNPSVIPTTGNYTVLFAQWSDAAASTNRSFKVTLSEFTQGKITYTHQTGAGPDSLQTNTVLKTNRWYHVVITSSYQGYYWYNRRQVEIYINGVRDATSPEVNSGYNSSLPLAIGADSAGNRKFRGYISNLRFVNESYERVYRYGWSAYLYYYYGWNPRPARVSVPSAPLQATTGTRLLALGATRIIDTGPGKKTITAYGTPSVSTYSPFSHSVVYSNEFDGSGDYIQADGALSSFTTSTSPFTIEFFWYQDAPLDNNPAPIGITQKTTAAGMLVLQSNILRVNDTVYTHGIRFKQNIWQHVALTYDGSRVRVYLDGDLKFTTPTTVSFTQATLAQCNFLVGARYWTSNGTTGSGANNFINGYISNLRVASKVVYTGSPFAVTQTPLETTQNAIPRGNISSLIASETKLLTCQGEILTDYSTNAVTVTASGDVIERDFSPFSFSKMYATQFFGNGHIRADSSLSSYTKTTDAFTVEFWWYSTVNITNAMAPFCISPFTVSSGRAANNLVLFSDQIYLKGVGYNHNIPFSDNIWTHVAITYDGKFVKIYKNGVLGWTSPDLISFIPFYECVLGIGCDFDSSDGGNPTQYITGYLSNFRMTQKVVYTGNFKLPPEPLHATQNQDTNIASIARSECTLLTCQSEAIVDNSEPSDRLETRGVSNAGKPKPIAESPYAVRPGNNQSIFALAGDSGNGGGMTGTVLLTCHDKTLYDGSASGRTIKARGDTYISDFSRFSQGKGNQNPSNSPFVAGATNGYSAYFDGIGDYVSMPDSPYLELKAQDFTIECWIKTDPKNTQFYTGITSKRATSGIYGAFVIFLQQQALRVVMSTNGSSWAVNIVTNFLIKHQTWYHISVNRSGGQVRVYVNGVQVGTSSITGSLVDNTARLTVGACSADGAWDFTGYISNFRVVVGKCMYTTQYKVPASPLTSVSGTVLLLFQNRYFGDNSPYNKKGTVYGNTAMTSFSPFASTIVQEKENDYDGAGASTYFDGIGTRFQIQNTEALQIKTQPATIEFWMYPERQDGDRRIATATLGNISANVFAIGYADNRFGLIGVNNDPIPWMSIAVTSENYPRLNAWNHIAWVGTTNKEELYVNGQRVVSSANAYNYTDAVRFIGGYDQTSQAAYFQGHLTNLRTVIGTPVYRDDKFTVPQAPLENYSSGTGLLTFQNETVVDNSPNSFDISSFGTTSPRHFSPFKLEDVETKAAPRDTLVTNGGVGGNGGLYGGGGGGNGGTVGTYGTSGAGAGASGKSSAVDGRVGTGAGGGGGFHTGSKGVFRFINNQVVGNRSNDGGVRSGGGDGATAHVYTGTEVTWNGAAHVTGATIKAGPGGGGGGSAGVDGQGGGDGGKYGGGGGGDSKGRFAGTGYGGQGLIIFTYNNTAGSETRIFLTTVGRRSWNVPNDFVSLVQVECIGGGGAGSFGGDYGAGGGGAAYAASINVAGLTPNRTVYYRVGRRGEPNNGVEATWSWFNTQPFDVGSEIDTIPLDSTQGALADYGRNGAGVTVGLGGQADNCIGDVRLTGGRGGTSFAFESCGGGGGAAGPAGRGGAGGNSSQQPSTSGGGGGGANGGGNAQPGALLVGGSGGNGAVVQGVIGGLGAQGIIIFNYFKVGDFQPQTIFITNTSQRLFRVPSNFLRLISIEAIGAGGNGFTAFNDTSAYGGGGGAYSRTTNVPVLVANRECYINVGSAYDESGRDSWLNANINSRPANANQGVVAKGGGNGGPKSPGLGGQAGQCIGEVRYSGGNGGKASLNLGASGGGGAAGPNGDGQVGGDTFTTNSLFVPTAGGGGGGANGGGRGGVGLVDAGGPGGGGDVNQNANGVNGEETVVQYQGSTLTAGGGRGGQFNNSQPGLGGNGVGGDVNSRGGQGSGAKGNTGGSGGGAIGGGNAITDAGNAGDPGAAALDVSGLGTVLRLLNVNFQANGAGKGAPAGQQSTQNLNRGGNAVQFGAGGGGAGYWGGDGGDGLYGGGGGGAAGYSDTQRGGKGGNGVLVAQFENGTPNVAIITSGTTYTVPARTSAVKIWVVGAGGGGAGASASNGTAGGGGGAGALVIKTFSSNVNLAGTFTSGAGAPGASNGRGGASIFPDNTANNGRPGTLGIPDGTPGQFGGGGAGGFAANAQQIEYAGTRGGDGYVKLVITNYAQPGRPETMPNIIQRHSTFSSDASNIVIRAAHVNNMYQNLVGWAGSTHTHDVSDEY